MDLHPTAEQGERIWKVAIEPPPHLSDEGLLNWRNGPLEHMFIFIVNPPPSVIEMTKPPTLVKYSVRREFGYMLHQQYGFVFERRRKVWIKPAPPGDKP